MPNHQVYDASVKELEDLHTEKNVSLWCVELSHLLYLCALYMSQVYEAELEMVQEQKKTYEAKMEEYEALQLQKKVEVEEL